jgi:hypothetical protein
MQSKTKPARWPGMKGIYFTHKIIAKQLKNELKFFCLVHEHCTSQENYGWNLSCLALPVCN